MGKIILVAESGSDVTADLRERYGIKIVPMHVIFGDVTRDEEDPVDQRSDGI